MGAGMAADLQGWTIESVDFSNRPGRAGEYYRVVLASGATRCPTLQFVTEGALEAIAHRCGLAEAAIAQQPIVLRVVRDFVAEQLHTGWDPTKAEAPELESRAAEFLLLERGPDPTWRASGS